MTGRLKPYRGQLRPSSIAEGMNAALRNAKSLVEDAEILFERGKYARSLGLAILAIEETGKLSILSDLSTAEDKGRIKEAWSSFRSHRSKNRHWILADLVRAGATQMTDFRPIFDDSSDHPDRLDMLKQSSLYIDCTASGSWAVPDDIIDRKVAHEMLTIAKVLSKGGAHSELEIELWKKHIGPSREGTLSEQKVALKNWFQEMKESGLCKEGNIPFEAFVGE